MFKSTYGTMYYVDNMKAAVEFYKTKWGLQPSHESPDWTEFAVGDHNICLHVKRAGEKYRENGVMIFNVEGVKGLFDKMGGQGIRVEGLHQVHPEAWTFHGFDNSGNEFSFYGSP